MCHHILLFMCHHKKKGVIGCHQEQEDRQKNQRIMRQESECRTKMLNF